MLKMKKILIVLLIGGLTLGLAGCSGGASQTATGQSGTSQTATKPDPNQPDRMAEVYGKIKSVEGNVIIVAETQRPQGGTEMTEEEKAKQREKMMSMSEEERKKFMESQQAPTGKNITVTVPVGVPVKIKSAGITGPKISEGALSDLKPGKVVSIWVEKDGATAEYVSIANR